MGKLGVRTPRAIDASARWTDQKPRGWRFWAARSVALAAFLTATTGWGDIGWLVGVASFAAAELIAPAPTDADEPARRVGRLTPTRLVTVGLLVLLAAVAFLSQPHSNARDGLILLAVGAAEWLGPRVTAAIQRRRVRGT